MKSTATSSVQHAVKTMSVEQKKYVAVAAFSGEKTITQIAKEIESSRKFVRGQKAIVAGAVDAAFH
ncbi:MAG: hypothetical protein ACI9Y1_002450, partial [Lentisphaeria bacterium]